MRLVLVLIVAALVYDAVANDAAYTKAAWREITSFFDDNAPAQPGERI